MAYVVPRRSGSWELRESLSTAAGPRSRTLATFRTLTPEIIERAQARSRQPLDPSELRRAALRAGAPVAGDVSSRAAGDLLAELSAGRRPPPAIRRLLADALGPAGGAPTDSERAVAPWIAATHERRGQTLRDLLLLADRLPARKRPATSRFPRLDSKFA